MNRLLKLSHEQVRKKNGVFPCEFRRNPINQQNLLDQREQVQRHILPLHLPVRVIPRMPTEHNVRHNPITERASLGRRVLPILVHKRHQLSSGHISALLLVSYQLRPHVRDVVLVSESAVQHHCHTLHRLFTLLLLLAHSDLDLIQSSAHFDPTLQTAELCVAKSSHGDRVPIQRHLRHPLRHLIPHHTVDTYHHQ